MEKRGTSKRLITNDNKEPPTRRFQGTLPYKSPEF